MCRRGIDPRSVRNSRLVGSRGASITLKNGSLGPWRTRSGKQGSVSGHYQRRLLLAGWISDGHPCRKLSPGTEGVCVCIVHKLSYELMRQAVRRADRREAICTERFNTATGQSAQPAPCSVQLIVDGSTHRGKEKKTVLFVGRVGRSQGKERKQICANYNGILKIIFEGETADAATLAFELEQAASVKILGPPLTDYAKNVLKDDGKGLEAGLLRHMEDSNSKDLKLWGSIISELYHRRKNLKKNFPATIGESCVDFIRKYMHMTATSSTTACEFHVF